MTMYLRAGCLFIIAALSSCHDDPSDARKATNQPATARSITLSTDSAGLVTRTTAKGMSVHLDERFQNAVMARRNADGSTTIECHDDHDQAEAFLHAPAATHEVR